MGATRALVTIRMADGKTVYINDAVLAEKYIMAQCGSNGLSNDGDDISQRLAVIEASLRVQKELAFDGKPLPCLHQAVQALRILNKANGDAKHQYMSKKYEKKETSEQHKADANWLTDTMKQTVVKFAAEKEEEKEEVCVEGGDGERNKKNGKDKIEDMLKNICTKDDLKNIGKTCAETLR